jgi:hypothetical protein
MTLHLSIWLGVLLLYGLALLFALALCKAAGDADRAMERIQADRRATGGGGA